MEPNQRLSGILSQRGRNTTTPTVDPMGFTTFLNLFVINLVHRFPNITYDIDQLPVDEIQRLAEFSVYCSKIALDTWNQVVVRQPTEERRSA